MAAQPTKLAVVTQSPVQPGGTILVVEDQAGIRTVIDRTLSRAGFTVLQADTGEAALRLIDEGRVIDLLLTDVILAGMTGIELREKSLRLRPQMKVVFMSGYSAAELPLGADVAFLEKPFGPDALLACVSMAIRESDGSA